MTGRPEMVVLEERYEGQGIGEADLRQVQGGAPPGRGADHLQ